MSDEDGESGHLSVLDRMMWASYLDDWAVLDGAVECTMGTDRSRRGRRNYNSSVGYAANIPAIQVVSKEIGTPNAMPALPNGKHNG